MYCHESIRRIAVRETGVSRHHGDPIEGPPETPCTSLHYRRDQRKGSYPIQCERKWKYSFLSPKLLLEYSSWQARFQFRNINNYTPRSSVPKNCAFKLVIAIIVNWSFRHGALTRIAQAIRVKLTVKMYQFARIPTTRSNMLFWEGILRQAQENRISFSLKLNGIWLWWQFFRFWAQSYSMWCKIERKTVTTIIFHSISKEKEIYFPECSYQVPFFPAFVEGQAGISTTIRRTTIREASASRYHGSLIYRCSPWNALYMTVIWYRRS